MKVEHWNPNELLYPFPNPKWKWDILIVDFIICLPRTIRKRDSLMVVVDKHSKDALVIMVLNPPINPLILMKFS